MTCAFAPHHVSLPISLSTVSIPMSSSSWKDRVISSGNSTSRHAPRARSGKGGKSSRRPIEGDMRRGNGGRRRKAVSGHAKVARKTESTNDIRATRTINGQVITLHTLHTPWTLYYHSPTLQDWSPTSYMEVATFNTVEEFWTVFDKFPKACFHMGMFFFMREQIKPTWEDEHNSKGGCWSYKIPMKHIYSVWRNLAALLVAESLSTTPMLLNGLSVSPKRGFCIVKVWGHDSKRNDHSLLRLNEIEHIHPSEVLYTPFNEKK